MNLANRIAKLRTRTALALIDNRAAVGFVVVWLAVATVVLARDVGVADAVVLATCLRKVPAGPLRLYQSFTEVVVFGVVASLVVSSVTSRHRPERTSRALASSARGHVVVVGMSNLGRRIHELVVAHGKPVVVVDADPANVAELVLREDPVVVGDAKDPDVLDDAAVAYAAVVVLATDDLETAAVAARAVRERNEACELVVRCPDEDVGAVLARTYRARVVSTSRLAARFVLGVATKHRAKSVVVLSDDHFGKRVAEALQHARVPYVVAPVTEDPEALRVAGVADADLVVVCDDDLGKNLVRVERIRALGSRARIVCRAFHDEAAKVLERAPFSCTVLSTSRHAAHALVRAGALRRVGIETVEVGGAAPPQPAAPLGAPAAGAPPVG